MTTEEFDALAPDAAVAALLECCSARAWAERVAAARPLVTAAAVQAAAARALAELDEAGIDEALAGHPRIGERSEHASSRREQAGVVDADPSVLEALAAGNREYEERFGHVYLVCADGRPAAELLAVLRERLRHDPATERAAVRTELGRITAIRLDRMLEER